MFAANKQIKIKNKADKFLNVRQFVIIALLFTLQPAISLGQNKKVFSVETNSRATARRKKAVAYVMSCSEDDMLALVPQQSGIYFTDCPNCETGAQDRGNWQWLPEKPSQIKCQGCGATYPNNPRYADNKYVAVTSPKGKHHYHYYERPDGYRIYFRAHADYLARDYMASICRDLAERYWTTRDEKYARRSALILIRFAEVYPGYAYKYDYPFRQKKFSPYTQNRIKGAPPFYTSRWSRWAYNDVSRELLRAYDILRFWPRLEEMEGGKAKSKIENDLFVPMVQFVMGFEETYSNMSPRIWTDFINAGRVLNQPEWIKEALKRSNSFMSNHFLYDGFWRESSPSYARQVLYYMTSMLDAFNGYEPPKNTPEGIAQFIRHGMEENKVAIASLEHTCNVIQMPSGGNPTINDTWAKPHVKFKNKSTESILMPALGLAILGGGTGQNQIYSWLNYTSGVGHKHKDALSIGLVGFDNELLRDIGYTHTKWRTWSASMMSHNTVVVNGLDSKFDVRHTKHRLRVFVTDGKGFHLAEAESDAAYPEITRRFRRTLVLVGADCRNAYLIDIFQITGGRQHDYLLHGSAAEDSTARVVGATLKSLKGTLMNPGTKFKYSKGESFDVGRAGGFGFVQNLLFGRAEENIILDLRLSSRPSVGTRTHLLCPAETDICVGQAPRIRQAERKDHLLPKFQAPFFCARRKGDNLKSVFIAVHEPVNGSHKIEGIAAKPLKNGVLLTVNHRRDKRDYFVMAFDDQISVETITADGRLQFEGAWGLLRTEDKDCVEAHLVGGKLLRLNESQLTGIPGWNGTVSNVSSRVSKDSRGYFDVVEVVDPSNAGAVLLVEFPDKTVRAYNLKRIEKRENGMRFHVVENPGYTVTDKGVKLLTYPQRTIQGKIVRYRLFGVTHAVMNE